MTTAVLPEFAPNLSPPAPVVERAVDLDALVAQELESLHKFYAEHDQARSLPHEDEWFVRKCLQRHLPLIRSWGSWRFDTPLTDVFIDPETIAEEISAVTERWRDGAVLNKRSYPPIPFRKHRGEHERMYCDTFGCHVPAPLPSAALWSERTSQDDDDDAPFAYGFSTKLRRGQSITKAVLNTVRKQYKGNETYIAFWEGVMEAIGIQYATAKPYRIVLSTAPSDFMQLGLLGETSCYTTGGEWERAKIHLSAIPNSVVMLIYREGTVRPVGRAWGILAPKSGGAEFTNFYMLPRPQILPGLRRALQEALKLRHSIEVLDTDDHVVRASVFNGHMYAYVNNDAVLIGPNTLSGIEDVQKELKQAIAVYRGNTDRAGGEETHPTCPGCMLNTGSAVACFRCSQVCCASCICQNIAIPEQVYCDKCAARAGWYECTCGRWTSKAVECAGSFDLYCAVCAAEKLTQCDRCDTWQGPEYLATCERCKSMRCGPCTTKNEKNEGCDDNFCEGCQRELGMLPELPKREPIEVPNDRDCPCEVCQEHRNAQTVHTDMYEADSEGEVVYTATQTIRQDYFGGDVSYVDVMPWPTTPVLERAGFLNQPFGRRFVNRPTPDGDGE
jgi:hypothetical protein